MKKLNAAQMLQGFVWKNEPVFNFNIREKNKIYIPQDELLNFAMAVQEHVFEEQPVSNSNSKITKDKIRDIVITGHYMIGEMMKEPLDWKIYANKLEDLLVENNGTLK